MCIKNLDEEDNLDEIIDAKYVNFVIHFYWI